MSIEINESLDDIFDDFDSIFEKKKSSKKNKQKFTQTESFPQREMVFAQPTEPEITPNGGIICYGESYKSVLEGLAGSETIFLDLETGSYDSSKDSLNPWQNCWPIGIAICAGCLQSVNEDEKGYGPAYYIPVTKNNEQAVYDLLFKIFIHPNFKRWINHNIKYDAHVLHNCAGINSSEFDSVELIDTLTLAKLVDSERFRYGLDALSKDWLDEDISPYEKCFKPYLHRNKDYSVIPVDIIGPYACQDVLTNRKLYKYICDNLPPECNYVRNIEVELTKILIKIEQNGLRINPEELERTEIQNTVKLLEIEQKLEKITGKSFRPHTNADCFDILCNFYGLPVLKWTNQDSNDGDTFSLPDEDGEEEKDKTSNASFDKHAMVSYLSHPTVLADKRIRIVVKLIAKYRKINTFNNLFVKKYRELATGELLHPFYNQCVRSGRMSCKKPNSQQLNKKAKSLIKPYQGDLFVSYDFCVTGDTELITPYGNKTIIEVIENNYPVLGYKGQYQGFEFCSISAGAKIGRLPVYRVKMEDGTHIDCTEEHGFLSRYGKRIDCKDLEIGDRLAHVYNSRNGYYPSFKCSNDEDRLNQAVHILVGDWKYGTAGNFGFYEYHHIDEDKNNYLPENIEKKLISKHRSEHSKENYKKQDHEYRIEKLREGIEYRDSYEGAKNPNWNGGKIVLICENCDEEFELWPSQVKVKSGKGYTSTRKYCSKECFREAQKKGNWYNHRVVSVEYLGVQDVYSITNPITHNYVSANGAIHFNSQIEYRTIAHYIESPILLEEYNNNPDADFHEFVAKLVREETGLEGMTRSGGKTLNFGLGFNMGRAKLLKSLMGNLDLMGNLVKEIDHMIESGLLTKEDFDGCFNREAESRAEKVYDAYHKTFPEMKKTSRKAQAVCEQRGYIFNLYRRRRHLERRFAYKAFNTINQSSAADIMKDAMVRIGKLLQKCGNMIKIVADVHDEILFSMPVYLAEDMQVLHTIAWMLEHPNLPDNGALLVPIRVAMGIGDNWKKASTSAKVYRYDQAVSIEKFERLLR